MYTPKRITEIRDGSTESEEASSLPITQGLQWGQMNPSKENQGTRWRDGEIDAGKESKNVRN